MNRMLKICAVVAMGTLVLPLKSLATDNPYRSAKVGEWVENLMITETMGRKVEMKMKQTIVDKDDVSVTMRTTGTMMGREIPPQDTKILLNQTYDPYTQGYTDAKVTRLGEGDETVSVGGKSYKCHWEKVKVVATRPAAVESTFKLWSSKDVPLSGMVKMESDSVMTMGTQTMNTKMTMVLTGSGK